ncbi:hypothetical protein [[Mycobacterium] nativiensis]|uniref:Uncharacterized protein n=1 Tax=[Mycobacterium] nativiensis TaxID=2855503 RepID=A0ABU5XWN9_9MYCO|nr:hypothetical protein [Mycolicibacter sp. MYC340]MEB3032338.1 hypothetical protein [Mycolicibacter sp. MYC340]
MPSACLRPVVFVVGEASGGFVEVHGVVAVVDAVEGFVVAEWA